MSHLTPTRTQRPGFTLVELLAAMLIMAVLAAFFMSALQQVEGQARVERTKAMIARLDQIIMEKYEAYRTRVVPLRIVPITSGGKTYAMMPQDIASVRLKAIRELMRMELPDRIADLADPPGDIEHKYTEVDSMNNPLINNPPLKQQIKLSQPATYRSMRSKAVPSWLAKTDPNSSIQESAECLYLIVATSRNGDKAALDYFTAREVGDTDKDGMPELLDAWGEPIQYLRWAPGYVKDHTDPTRSVVTMQTRDATSAPDPYDPLRMDPTWTTPSLSDWRPFALKPLIFSGGPDRKLDINFGESVFYSGSFLYPDAKGANVPYGPSYPYYFDTSDLTKPRVGAVADYDNDGFNHYDNITNHYVEVP